MDHVTFSGFTNTEIAIRILLSVLLGFILGFERELTNKSAGLRTHILVCLGSTIFTIMSVYFFPTMVAVDNPARYGDPGRIAAQIITGIGFIGGGTVLRHGSTVSGLTTAALLWVSAGIGMAVGVGAYNIAIVSTLLAVIILVAVRKIEIDVLSKFTRKETKLRASITCLRENSDNILNSINEEFKDITGIRKKETDNEDEVKLTIIIRLFQNDPFHYTYGKIKALKGVNKISLQQATDEL